MHVCSNVLLQSIMHILCSIRHSVDGVSYIIILNSNYYAHAFYDYWHVYIRYSNEQLPFSNMLSSLHPSIHSIFPSILATFIPQLQQYSIIFLYFFTKSSVFASLGMVNFGTFLCFRQLKQNFFLKLSSRMLFGQKIQNFISAATDAIMREMTAR